MVRPNTLGGVAVALGAALIAFSLGALGGLIELVVGLPAMVLSALSLGGLVSGLTGWLGGLFGGLLGGLSTVVGVLATATDLLVSLGTLVAGAATGAVAGDIGMAKLVIAGLVVGVVAYVWHGDLDTRPSTGIRLALWYAGGFLLARGLIEMGVIG